MFVTNSVSEKYKFFVNHDKWLQHFRNIETLKTLKLLWFLGLNTPKARYIFCYDFNYNILGLKTLKLNK